MKPSVSRQQAETELNLIATRLEQQYPESNKGRRVLLTPLHESFVDNVRTMEQTVAQSVAASSGYIITSRISALNQLPPPPRSFTGRTAQLRDSITKLQQGGADTPGLHIHGLGGVGKTAFALKLAEQIASFYHAQLYLDLKGTSLSPTTVAEVMAYVTSSFHPAVEMPEKVLPA